MKKCKICKEIKSLSDFHKHPSTKDKHQSLCKKCVSLKRNTVGKNNQLKKRYGISLIEYNEMLLFQNYKCNICGTHQDNINTSLHVDHNHTTGKIRGLLCANCNRALGWFQDSIENLESAISYLKRAENFQHTNEGVPASYKNALNE